MPTPFKISNDIKFVTFEIEDKVCEVPIASSLMPEELETLTTKDGLSAFFEKHIGAELWKKLNIGARNQISDIWANESTKKGGVEPGKSSASPES